MEDKLSYTIGDHVFHIALLPNISNIDIETYTMIIEYVIVGEIQSNINPVIAVKKNLTKKQATHMLYHIRPLLIEYLHNNNIPILYEV